MQLIGIVLIIVGFALKLDTIAVVVGAGIATGLVAHMNIVEILNTLGEAFITNRSTGKMGYSIAKEARDRGADVVLVSGPTNLPQIKGIKTIKVNTNEEMKLAMLSEYNDSDIVIKSAAVADYKPLEYSEQKIKKSEGDWNLVLTRDSDILRELGERKIKQILVGFAAESNNIIENARTKIHKKNLDYIVANDITANDAGFGSEDNRVIILSKDGTTLSLDKMSKSEVACNIFDMILGKR